MIQIFKPSKHKKTPAKHLSA